MAANEDMAISFYGVGDSSDLANKLVTLLQSPQQQHRMAEHNFSAALEMTMESVVRNYLRWFELKQCQKTIGAVPLFADWRALWPRFAGSRDAVFPVSGALRAELEESAETAGIRFQSIRQIEPKEWPRPETADEAPGGHRNQSGPQLADEF